MPNHHIEINKRYILSAAIIGLVLLIDQSAKVAVKTTMFLGESIPVCDWFSIFFIENEGMAFGMTWVDVWMLTLFRILFLGVILYLVFYIIKKKLPMGFLLCVSAIAAGALGNIIDNTIYGLIFSESTPYSIASSVPLGEGYAPLFSGKVVDMLFFPLFEFDWPEWIPIIGGKHFLFFSAIFNFADASISCSGVCVILFYRHCLTQLPLLNRWSR